MKSKGFNIFILFLMCTLFVSTIYLLAENTLLTNKLRNRESSIKTLEVRHNLQIKAFESKLDSLSLLHNNDFSISNAGKKVTIASIVNSANQWYKEKEKYKLDLLVCNGTLKAYQIAYGQASNKAVKNAVASNKNAEIARKSISVAKSLDEVIKKYDPTKYQEYEFFYQMVKKYYGLDYQIKKQADSTKLLSFSTSSKLDSALQLLNDWKKGKLKVELNIIQERKAKKGKN